MDPGDGFLFFQVGHQINQFLIHKDLLAKKMFNTPSGAFGGEWWK
jgi:hypothetical protein